MNFCMTLGLEDKDVVTEVCRDSTLGGTVKPGWSIPVVGLVICVFCYVTCVYSPSVYSPSASSYPGADPPQVVSHL